MKCNPEILDIKLNGWEFEAEYRSGSGEILALTGDIHFKDDLPYTSKYLINHGQIWASNSHLLDLINDALESSDYFHLLAEHRQEQGEWQYQSLIEDRFN